jgi:hypothetical protein
MHIKAEHSRPPCGLGSEHYWKIIELAAERRPVHARGITYALLGRPRSKARSEERRVGEALLWAREVGDLNREAIIDQRSAWRRVPLWDNAEGLAEQILGQRRNHWQDQNVRVVLISENPALKEH